MERGPDHSSIDYRSLFERILEKVDSESYFTPSVHVDDTQRRAVAAIERQIQRPDFDADQTRQLIRALHEDGQLSRVMMLSALHVVACHPQVADWEEAARLVGEQEFAALELGGPELQANLASVDRHRGVLAFLRGHYQVALDYFARALERQRSAENLTNILCTLVRLGDEDEGHRLLRQIRRVFPAELTEEIDRAIETDPDLAFYRSENLP